MSEYSKQAAPIENESENEAEISTSAETDTKPSAEGEVLIPVKFNKQIKNLSIDEAGTLAGKGMKYDLIAADYGLLRELAAEKGLSVGAYLDAVLEEKGEKRKSELLEKCGGDEELAGHILTLEKGNSPAKKDGFEELKQHFPEIKTAEDLPDEVTERAALRGTVLLDEYLRYRLRCERELCDAKDTMKRAEASSVGSQKQPAAGKAAASAEFLRGIWGR